MIFSRGRHILTRVREQDDWADLPAQESDMLTRRKKLGSKKGDALAAAVLQLRERVRWCGGHTLAMPTIAGRRASRSGRDELESTRIAGHTE